MKKIFKVTLIVACIAIGFVFGVLYLNNAEKTLAATDYNLKMEIDDKVIYANSVTIYTKSKDFIDIIEEPEETPEPAVEEPKELSTEVDIYDYFTWDDIVMLSKLVYGEACNQAYDQQAAVVWCVLNRMDSPRFTGNDIRSVVTAPYQFAGYKDNKPVLERHIKLVTDVLERYLREKNGETNVGRTLPKDYYYFVGFGGYNHFSKVWRQEEYWDFSNPNPYENW